MVPVLYVVFYVAAVVFLIACVARFLMYARTPVHLRWELYPVPHEPPEKAKHGGSYFEEVDWWEKEHKSNPVGEAVAMATEILFLKALYEHNRPLWYSSFPFHFGLYLLIGAGGLLILGALVSLLSPAAMAGGFGLALHWGYTVLGAVGLGLSLLGALGLLVKRSTDRTLRQYSNFGDYFNLLFFIVTFGVLGAAHLVGGPGYYGPLAAMIGIITFNTAMPMTPLFTAGLVLLAVLVAYIPLTHMSHFIGKYFTYHSIRWGDEANQQGSKIDQQVQEALAYKPTWAAGHMKTDGTRNWVDAALINPTDEEG